MATQPRIALAIANKSLVLHATMSAVTLALGQQVLSQSVDHGIQYPMKAIVHKDNGIDKGGV